MGNSASNSDTDEDNHLEHKEEDAASDEEQDSESDAHVICNIASLFDTETLRNAASKIKEDLPENIIQQHSQQLHRWLSDRLARNEESVTIAQFCEFLMNRSVERDECVRAFEQFDAEGDGTADAQAMLDTVKTLAEGNMQGELGYVIRMLQACSQIPGFIDVYTKKERGSGKHSRRLLNFLLRNRSPSASLPLPFLDSYNKKYDMRVATLAHYLSKMKDVASRKEEEDMLQEGEELKPITKCFTSMEVSTNRVDAYRLSNGEFSSYWQSDGSARSHWIRLRMKSNVVLKQLSISVAASDQSYMPQLVTVSVGKNIHALREIKEIRVPSHTTGDVMLLENAKVFYPVVQINIKRCQSDGCDTRVHTVKTVGYRIIKDPGISVLDASAVWYMQVMASTVAATMPLAPTLRTAILQHTREALKHMPPLSLSPGSADKPPLLSSHVLKQMDQFLTDIVVGSEGSFTEDSILSLLGFNLARGHVAGTLRTLHVLQSHMDLRLECSPIFQKMDSVRESYWKKYGSSIHLTLAGCDGGQKDETSGPSNVLSTNWSVSQGYLSGDNRTRVNMIFKGTDYVQITKIKIKVDKGPRGPKRGMVFVYKSEGPFNLEEHVAKFSGYDTWTSTEYSFLHKVRSSGLGGKPDNPVGFFTLEDDWNEVEVPLDACPVGQYVLVKFLEPRQNTAERLGVIGIKFFGYHRKAVFVDNLQEQEEQKSQLVSDQKETSMSVKTVISKTLAFFTDMARDQQPTRRTQLYMKPQALDMSDTSLQLLWKLYKGFKDEHCQRLTLQLLHTLFPFFSDQKDSEEEAREQFFKHLCDIVDTRVNAEEEPDKSKLQAIAGQLIKDGAAVFFPDKEARGKHLFKMVTSMNDKTEASSVTLTFQSLCQFFGSVDPSGLLDLPHKVTKDFDCSPMLQVMETLITVASQEFPEPQGDKTANQSFHLMHLLCSLQTSLMSWCHTRLQDSPDKEVTEVVQNLMLKYVSLVTGKAVKVLQELLVISEKEVLTAAVSTHEWMFLGTAFCQLILLLNPFADILTSTARVKMLNQLMSSSKELKRFSEVLPEKFPAIEENFWKAEDTEVMFKTWEVESPHNYENNQHSQQVFSCPGASTFLVEFDPRSETEKRYDYLEFTDSRGVKTRYDQKVGSDKWPTSVTFKGGHQLQFLFHSDSSNTEWGYKFKVTASGIPDIPLCWIHDLQLSISKLLGKISGATLDCSKLLPKADPLESNDDPETELLKSELWTTLFRGGYMVGKLQRSLSGKHVAVDDASVASFLWSMQEEDDGKEFAFLDKCKENCTVPQIGAADVGKAVTAVFAALIWHTQSLREEIEKIVKSEGDLKISDGLQQAYNTAQNVRLYLVDLMQKQKVAAEKEGSQQDGQDPVTMCCEKAKFLLKFSGLAKVHLKSEGKNSKHSKSTSVSRSLSRTMSLTGEKIHKFESSLERYPSFRLVLEFVRDPAWSQSRVQDLLQERSRQALAQAEVFMFTAEFIRLSADQHIFQAPILTYLKELLSYQHKFSRHYLDGLDGCGLDLESRVRQSYYTLLRRLLDSLRAVERKNLSRSVTHAYDYIQASTLHFLDIAWQRYDLDFLVDLKIPEFFIELSKTTVSMREKATSEDCENKELEKYRKDMNWLEQAQSDFVTWYASHKSAARDVKTDVQMFVARFCDFLDVEINCDGCGVTLPGTRYRCLQCQDMDLCATCYAGGVKPAGEHTDEHEMVHLQYKCDECQAFIVGTRIHCNVCDDFDLCMGCHVDNKFPVPHSADHDTTKIPMIKLRLDKGSSTSLQAYIHQHVWLLFTAMALDTTHIIYTQDPGTSASDQDSSDSDYLRAAHQLHSSCIELVSGCLLKVSEIKENDEEEAHADEMFHRQELAFAIHAQERILGLLGAMIPFAQKTNAPADSPEAEKAPVFATRQFMQLLLKIATGESNHEQNIQHLCMGLIGQLLQQPLVSPQVTDQAVAALNLEVISPDSVPGMLTAEYLFNFGATCLERSGLDWAHTMANILQSLFAAPTWHSVFSTHVQKSIQELAQKPGLSSIFGLFVMAGFPEVYSFGCHVTYSEAGTEVKRGVVLKHFPDRHQSMVVDIKSRKRRWVKDEYLENVREDLKTLSAENLGRFSSIVKELGAKIQSGDSMTVEKVWVLALSLKALLKAMKEGRNPDMESLFNAQFIRVVVQLAGMGTDFSKEWLLKDLEVLSLMLYTKSANGASGDTSANESKNGDSSAPPSQESSPQKDPGSSNTTGSDVELEGLDSVDQELLKEMHEQLEIPLGVLRAVFEMNGKNAEAMVSTLQENLQGSSVNPREVRELMAKLDKPKVKPDPKLMLDKGVDTGIQYTPQPELSACSYKADLAAVEEVTMETQKLITPSDQDKRNDVLKKRKSQSASLLSKELESQGRAGSRDFLIKVNQAVAVLYARQVLLSLLDSWPAMGPRISAELIGCKESSQVPYVLDLLNRTEPGHAFKEVVQNVIQHCEPDCLVPIATTACYFMEEVTMSSLVRESEHNYKNETSKKEKLHIPGASYLSIRFDSRCATEEGCDELVFATSSDYKENKQVFSGTRDCWTDLDIPGDTLYYKFTSDCSNNDWGYKFTVTGGKLGRFNTGFLVLKAVFSLKSMTSLLPLDVLWGHLVCVACKQTGQERLGVLHLLLRIMTTQFKSEGCEKLHIDLTMLRPMWQLYNKISVDSQEGGVMPSLVRALTELFFQAESLALEWGKNKEYVAWLQDDVEIQRVMLQGLTNIAAISKYIGYENKATQLLDEAASKTDKAKEGTS